AIATPMRRATSEDVTRAFVDQVADRFGSPLEVMTDRAPAFNKAFRLTLGRVLGINHVRTTAYHPQTNGLVERFHCTLKTMLRMYLRLDSPGNDWEVYLPDVCLAHNTAIHEHIRLSPFEMMYGTEARVPFETLIPSEVDPPTSLEEEQRRAYQR